MLFDTVKNCVTRNIKIIFIEVESRIRNIYIVMFGKMAVGDGNSS